VIVILSGIGAARAENKWWPAYFIGGAIIAAGFLLLSTKVIT
jgi:hypothetical protein